MRKKYSYTILIKFSSATNQTIGTFNVEYPYSNNSNLKDNVIINGKYIKITAERSKKSHISDIIHNANTAMNRQISKSLAYYYAVVGEPNPITSIKISRHFSGNVQEEKTIHKTGVRQIINSDNGLSELKRINSSELANLFRESEAGRALLYAVTHLVNFCSSPEPFQRFESLWKSFNSIYKLKQANTQDKSCLRDLREHMVNHSTMYPLSAAHVRPMTHDQIFSIVNWRDMILNDYKQESHSRDLLGFIQRISDRRLIQKIEDSLPIRQQFS